jgi:cytochrome P450
MLERLNSLPPGAVSLLLLAAIPVILRFAYQALYYRRFKELERLPQLTPSLVWGHLKAMGELARKGEPDCDGDELLKTMFRMLGKPPLMVLDLRPLTRPMVVVCSHDVAEQISRSSKAFPWSLPKSPTMAGLNPLVGRHSVLMLEGEEWKALRRRFNPGFSPQHLMTLLPCILDKTQVFLRHLDGFCASGEEFCLEPLTINLTFDIIGS